MKTKTLFLQLIKKIFTFSKNHTCETCGWQTTELNSTVKLRQHCKPCNDKK